MKTVFEDPLENEIIMPCKCKKNPKKCCHVGCLRNYMTSQANVVSRSNSVTYQWKDLKCVDCGHDFPTQIRQGQDTSDMIAFRTPNAPCLVLEKTSKKEKNRIYVHEIVLLWARRHDGLRIGHGPNSDLRLNDISTSVLHAQVNFVDNRFMIFDNNSRYGTLIELRKPFKIQNHGVALQVENKVFNFYTEVERLVKTIRKRKFKRFEIPLNQTQRTIIMNLATRMKVFPASTISKFNTRKR